MNELIKSWQARAIKSREEADRIRRTVKQPTGAEERCNVRAELLDKCSGEAKPVIESLEATIKDRNNQIAEISARLDYLCEAVKVES